jgi:hypothetical protein
MDDQQRLSKSGNAIDTVTDGPIRGFYEYYRR